MTRLDVQSLSSKWEYLWWWLDAVVFKKSFWLVCMCSLKCKIIENKYFWKYFWKFEAIFECYIFHQKMSIIWGIQSLWWSWISNRNNKRRIKISKYLKIFCNHSEVTHIIMMCGIIARDLLPMYIVYKSFYLWDTWIKDGPLRC